MSCRGAYKAARRQSLESRAAARAAGRSPLERQQLQDKQAQQAGAPAPPPAPAGKENMTWQQRKLKPPGTLRRTF
jgi:hypothetical protein